MTTMVERVAESQARFDGRTLIAMPRGERERYFRRARAAIEAMREPTWQMCSAGGMEHSRMVEEKHADADDPDCRYIFEAMIDAALSEESK